MKEWTTDHEDCERADRWLIAEGVLIGILVVSGFAATLFDLFAS